MYLWLVFLRVLTGFAYILAHGVQAGVMWQLRGEAEPERSLVLISAMPRLTLLRIILVLLLATGLITGFMVPWWRQGWMWAAIGVLAIVGFLMNRFGNAYFDLLVVSARRAVEDQKNILADSSSLEAFHATRAAWHPWGVTIIGLVGLAVILWLMMFKPF
jgi:hypothetical protein